jgi:NAD(P)H-dependent flavin oxidoreductase YrpB (nitropropane dioxygenase family)
MHPHDVIVLSPPGLCHPSLAIAACRAGARGFLDVEHVADAGIAAAAIAQLGRLCAGSFGIRLGSNDNPVLNYLVADPPAGLSAVLLAGGDQDLQALINLFRRRPLEIFFEATDIAQARRAEALGVNGLILKGQEAGGASAAKLRSFSSSIG